MMTMKGAARVSTLMVLAALLFGCGEQPREDEVARLAVQQRQLERRLAEGLDAIASRLDAVTRVLAALRDDVAHLQASVAPAPGETPAEDASASMSGGGVTTIAAVEPESAALSDGAYLTLLAEIEALRVQVSDLQSGVKEVQTDAAQREERARLRDPREAWMVLGESEQLAKRLDRLAESFAPKIDDIALREQFKADIGTFRASILNPGTVEEIAERQRQQLREQLATTTNEQARRWIQRRLEGLNNASPDNLSALLENYVRYDSSRELRRVAEKYKIPRQVLQDVGLPAWGGGFRSGRPRGGG